VTNVASALFERGESFELSLFTVSNYNRHENIPEFTGNSGVIPEIISIVPNDIGHHRSVCEYENERENETYECT